MAFNKSLTLRNLQRTKDAPAPEPTAKPAARPARKSAPKKRHTGMARGKAKAMVGKAAPPKHSRRAQRS